MIKLSKCLVLAAGLFATIALAACGSETQGETTSTLPPATVQANTDDAETTPLPRPSVKQIARSTMVRPSAAPPFYYMNHYNAETTWGNEFGDRRVGAYFESAWHDPAEPASRMRIDSRSSKGAPTPLEAAELARAQATRLPEYHERSFKKVKLGPHSVMRLAYDAEGVGHLAFFFTRCDASIALRGSTDPRPFRYQGFSKYYSIVVSRLKVICGK